MLDRNDQAFQAIFIMYDEEGRISHPMLEEGCFEFLLLTLYTLQEP